MRALPGNWPGARPCACHTTRRAFLGAAAASGAAWVAGCAMPSGVAPAPRRIDVHHHITPPAYLSALLAKKMGEPPTYRWTIDATLADMEASGVATSILSITTPGVHLGNAAEARDLARACNEYAATLMAKYPGRFGSFAALPLPDVDGSLRELEHALDVLKADGVCLMTSADNRYLGDPVFAPVIDELNRRKAIVYTHPTAANCCRNLSPHFNPAVIEFATDTTRTLASLLFSGTAARCRDIRWIFSHAGGTMPFIIERFQRVPAGNPKVRDAVPDGVDATLRRFHYDVAQAAHPGALSSLMRLVPVSQVLYGTDYPFRSNADHVKGLAGYGFSAAELRAIERENAVRLMPRLANA